MYPNDEKPIGLDPVTTLAANDLIVVADISVGVRAAQSITEQDFEDTTGITQLKIDVTTLQGDVTTIQGDIVNLQSQINNIQVGEGGGFSQKIKSYSLEGLLGTPVQNGYQDQEAYVTADSTTVYAEFQLEFLQSRNVTADWADADSIYSYVVLQGFLYLLLRDDGAPLYRVYRYDITNLAAGGTLMTIATQALGTQDLLAMTSNGTKFYFNYKAGGSANDYVISPYSLSGTTLTYDGADITCGAVANACDQIAVFANGFIYGLNITGTRQIKIFNASGTLQDTLTPYDVDYVNLINWDETIYIAKAVGDDEAYRVSLETDDFDGGGSTKKVGVGAISDVNWFNVQTQFPIGVEPACILDLSNSSPPESTTFTTFATGDYIITNTNFSFLLPNFDVTPAGLTFDAPKMSILQVLIKPATFSPNNAESGVGFGLFADGTIALGMQGTNNTGIAFVRKDSDGQWYTHVASNDVGQAESPITLVDNTPYVLRIEYDPGNAVPQARFYVNGVLVNTTTTNLPLAGTGGGAGSMGFCVGNGGTALGIIAAGCPSFSVEI